MAEPKFASTRFKEFKDWLFELGPEFQKMDKEIGKFRGSTGKAIQWLAEKGHSTNLKSKEAMKALNDFAKKKGMPVWTDVKKAGKGVLTELENFLTKSGYAESGSRVPKEKVNVALKNIATIARDRFGKSSSPEKTKFIKSALTKMWPVLRGAGILSTTLATKALGLAPYVSDILTPTNITGFKKPKLESSEKVTPPVERFKGGGMTDINEMTKPLGYSHGGLHEEEGKTFGQGEFDYDDPNLIRFIQAKADQNETTYQEELMKFVDEVESFYRNKKNQGGIMNINQMTRPVHMEGGGETKTATASGMHPLVEWEEIYDAWIIDGGEEMPLWDFIEMMTKGIKKG